MAYTIVVLLLAPVANMAAVLFQTNDAAEKAQIPAPAVELLERLHREKSEIHTLTLITDWANHENGELTRTEHQIRNEDDLDRIRVIQRVLGGPPKGTETASAEAALEYEQYDLFDGEYLYSLSVGHRQRVPLEGAMDAGVIDVEKTRDLHVLVNEASKC